MNYSRQREAIITNLASRYDHPTADMVYDSIKIQYPKVSLGTIYRNLTQLAENGDIIKISTGLGPDRFDYNVKPHAHFICKCCGATTDLEIFNQQFFEDEIIQMVPGRVDRTAVFIYGVCPECLDS